MPMVWAEGQLESCSCPALPGLVASLARSPAEESINNSMVTAPPRDCPLEHDKCGHKSLPWRCLLGSLLRQSQDIFIFLKYIYLAALGLSVATCGVFGCSV